MYKSGESSKEFLQNKLLNILKYRSIQVSGAEIRSYSINEIKYLIKYFDVQLYNADSKNNSWYGNRRYYI